MTGRIGALVIVLLAVGAVGVAAPWSSTKEAPPPGSAREGQARGGGGALGHLRALQRIADRHGGNRAAGTDGYRASVAYVVARLRDAGYEVTVQRVSFESKRRRTVNVVADSPGRSGGAVVVAGAHLDSVAAGPGLNDNGSGVAALLSSAESLATPSTQDGRSLRFAFWGAEELGLIGSRRYVRGLGRAQRERIAAYFNLDMVGSRNSGRFLYASEDARAVAAIARRRLGQAGVPVQRTDLRGGSDHAPFQRAGIPVAGLFSGAAGVKTRAQSRRWGGRAGAPFDRCYHRACDRLDRIDRRSLRELGSATTETLSALVRG